MATNLEDKMRWKKAKDENFSIKYLYSVLEGSSRVSFLKSIIWTPCVSTRLAFLLGKLHGVKF